MATLPLLLGVVLSFGQPPNPTPDVGLLVDEEVFHGTVTSILAADRIEVQRGLDTLQVRLRGVGPLPADHPLHDDAIDLLSRMVLQRRVEVHGVLDPDSTDPDHLLAGVLRGGTNPARVLLQRGLAFYCRPPGGSPELESAEAEAREKRVGLWADGSPPRKRGRENGRCR